MTSTDIRAAAHLRTEFTGDVVLPADPAYEPARALFNSMIERRPAMITCRREPLRPAAEAGATEFATMCPMMTRVAVYCRISQDRGGAGLGIARQERRSQEQSHPKGDTHG